MYYLRGRGRLGRRIQNDRRRYALAYCTIAATSTNNSHTGFLGPRNISEYVYIQDNSAGESISVLT